MSAETGGALGFLGTVLCGWLNYIQFESLFQSIVCAVAAAIAGFVTTKVLHWATNKISNIKGKCKS